MQDSWAYMDKGEWALFGVPIIVWIGVVVVLVWLWGELQIRRWRREEREEAARRNGGPDDGEQN
ncbi:MAG: hypothetical protein AAFP17_01970 [Pseudomonadota bacterium]